MQTKYFFGIFFLAQNTSLLTNISSLASKRIIFIYLLLEFQKQNQSSRDFFSIYHTRFTTVLHFNYSFLERIDWFLGTSIYLVLYFEENDTVNHSSTLRCDQRGWKKINENIMIEPHQSTGSQKVCPPRRIQHKNAQLPLRRSAASNSLSLDRTLPQMLNCMYRRHLRWRTVNHLLKPLLQKNIQEKWINFHN